MALTKDGISPRSRLIAGMAKVLEQRALSELYADDVVREAGVSKRTFYQHFPNKEACFLALYRENSARVLGVLKEASGALWSASGWGPRLTCPSCRASRL
jgi:AcrR family transcriptional regulator